MAELITLKKRRATIKGSVTKLLNYLKAINQQTQAEEIKVRLSNIERLRDEFCKVEDQIVTLDNSEEMDSEFEDNYYKIVAGLNRALRTNSEPTMSLNDTMLETSVSGSHTEVKLPKISIPTFTGDYTEWQSFYDLFCSTIHDNPRLTPSQKLQYLKGTLTGEAAGLLKHFSITDANYIEAFKKLRERYDRKKHTIYMFVKKFMSQPSVTTASSGQVRRLLDTSDEIIRGLKALGESAESRDHWLIHILTAKLDEETNGLWAQSSANIKLPTLKEFFDFLSQRIDALESVRSLNRRIPPPPQQSKLYSVKTHTTATTATCCLCPDHYHNLYECEKMKKMSVEQRKDLLKTQNRCFNCLNNNHNVFNCKSRFRCRYCGRKHHTLIHENQPENSSISNLASQTVQIQKEETKVDNYSTQVGTAILPTALVNVYDGFKNKQTCRVLLDSGSQCSFITESCVQRLQLKRSNAKLTVSGIGGCKTGYTKGSVSITITPGNRDEPLIRIEALILPKLTSKQPQSGQKVNISYFNQFDLADPFFYKSADIDILIGSDKFFELLVDGKITTPNNLIMQNTVLGWIIAGQLPDHQAIQSLTISTSSNDENLDGLLRKFWELENVNSPMAKFSEEEMFCEKHFRETNKIDDTGRFVVRLPFKISPTILGETLDIAIQRMRAMEKKFTRNTTFAIRYKEFMKEYLSLGHMRPIAREELKAKGYYLPHHGVTKESSETTKLRVVFDGSTKSTTGPSLNECLAVGPTVQSSLFEIISRFREFKVAFTSDVEKMFRQVRIADEDCKYQRIVWRENPKEPFQHFELKTVTYGTASATFLATRTLNEAAECHRKRYPKAANHIIKNIYVDDLMAGADTVEEARGIKKQITSILSKSGFTLRKWLANDKSVLNQIDHNLNDAPELEIEESQTVKVLGLYWNPTKDVFQFRVQLNDQPVMTKRSILSETSRLFDPLGWIAPITVSFKIFLQSLWTQHLGWDDHLPHNVITEWLTIRNNLPNVEQIEIPRYINTNYNTKLELHGFSDASKDAYAAVVYARVTNSTGETKIQLLSAKTKVSPVKQISIPRLELCGAVLAKKLLFTVKNSLQHQVSEIHAWTDSTIVLDWLSAPPKKWNVFVGNRTAEILNDMKRSQWRHVSSQQNPADCASRGLSPEELVDCKLWWNGPEWLVNAKDWPIDNPTGSNVQEAYAYSLPIQIPENTLLDRLIEKYSSFNKLVRVLAFVSRFINLRLKRYSQVPGKLLRTSELETAEKIIFKHMQHKEFNDDIQCLKLKKPLSPTSRLKYLQPFLDEFELLRVGGRLGKANIKFNVQHPLILPAKNPMVNSLVNEHHLRHLHAGATLMMATLRSKYWIVGCRTLVRKVIHNCIRCVKYNAKELNQIMGDLPNARVEFIRPFYKVGVDYAGPLLTHIIRGRGQKTYKSYVCLFVCMATKAVHIELVSDLTTEAFIGALRRFIARRGICSEIYCDNGSNFIGAATQLTELYKFLNENANTISNSLLTDRISFKFIPPSSPHFGGLWEAAVKSTKFHLKRVTNGQILTIEEMSTLLTEIEAVLNSRPICILSSDELDYITPGHFLIGRPTTQLPSKDFKDIKPSKLNRWQLIQQMAQHFWERWQQEYLTNLQNRSKWHKKQKNVEIGDIVAIKDNNLAISKWSLGRIIEVHPGPDNNIRVVTLKTTNGILKRPIHKLCLLPVN